MAQIVWQLDGATVRQVFELLPDSRKAEVECKTVQTFLRRLEAKGYLKGEKQGRSIFYQVRDLIDIKAMTYDQIVKTDLNKDDVYLELVRWTNTQGVIAQIIKQRDSKSILLTTTTPQPPLSHTLWITSGNTGTARRAILSR